MGLQLLAAKKLGNNLHNISFCSKALKCLSGKKNSVVSFFRVDVWKNFRYGETAKRYMTGHVV